MGVMKLVKICASVCRRLSRAERTPRGIAVAYTVGACGFTMLEVALWLDRVSVTLHVAAAVM